MQHLRSMQGIWYSNVACIACTNTFRYRMLLVIGAGDTVRASTLSGSTAEAILTPAGCNRRTVPQLDTLITDKSHHSSVMCKQDRLNDQQILPHEI